VGIPEPRFNLSRVPSVLLTNDGLVSCIWLGVGVDWESKPAPVARDEEG
jgi:hypothetical protein